MRATKKQLEAINQLDILKNAIKDSNFDNKEAIDFLEFYLSIKNITKISTFYESIIIDYIEILKYYKEN